MRSIVRDINRNVQTSGGPRKVLFMEERAADSMADALNSVVHAEEDGDAMAPNMRELNRHSWFNFRSDHWLGRYAKRADDFYRGILHGAPEMRDRMLEMMDQIHLPAAALRPELTQRRRRSRGDFGNEVDIHRVYQGRSDIAWDKIHTEKVMAHGNRLVHMVIDISAPLLEHADGSMWLGAAVMRIHEALTRMGVSTAISVYGACHGLWTRGPATTGMVSILVKDYGAPLREEQLAVMSHLGTFRTLILPLLTIEGRARNLQEGMGYAVSDYNLRVQSAEEDERRGGNVVTVGKAFNQEQAERLIYEFVQTHVHGEIADGKSTRQLYGYGTAHEEVDDEHEEHA